MYLILSKLSLIFISTAPTAYQTEKVGMNQSPAYSFGIKHKEQKYSDTPGNLKSDSITVCCTTKFLQS